VVELHRRLPGAELIESKRHDGRYSHELRALAKDGFSYENWVQYTSLVNMALKTPAARFKPELKMWTYWASQGVPIDQTLGDALAQIQVVVRKSG
jgi:hypothetical protein